MVDRVAETWEEVISGMEYVLDGSTLRRLCARGTSICCHCEHRWDQLKLVGS